MQEQGRERRLVHIIDDELIVRRSLAAMANSLGYDAECYQDGRSFLNRHASFGDREQCLILDYRMSEMDGLEVLQHTIDYAIPIPVILLTGKLDSEVAVRAMRGGAVNCLQKPVSREQLQESLEDALALAAGIEKIHEARQHHVRFELLSDQEKQIVRLAADGYPNKRIATTLGVSIKTVEKYRRRAYEKLNVDSTALMARAVTLESMHKLLHSCNELVGALPRQQQPC